MGYDFYPKFLRVRNESPSGAHVVPSLTSVKLRACKYIVEKLV
jgi:hypothetical protein